jgi:hypothetical protein
MGLRLERPTGERYEVLLSRSWLSCIASEAASSAAAALSAPAMADAAASPAAVESTSVTRVPNHFGAGSSPEADEL